ncbi:alpha/beta hydrolase [Lentzea alba]|uniref:alpha/beta hydrolase n=1 Tax=Lentzea alba TaxID=2714351 RepID=UPI0039BF4DAB
MPLITALDNGVLLLTGEDEGHTAHLQPPCVDKIVDDYLAALTVPEPGRRCPH